ncbi:Na-translocating system protein MpsC family protein [Deferrisoma sp.]
MRADAAGPQTDPREALGRIYAQTMGVTPSRVDALFGRGLVVAVLYDATSPAEQDLCRREDGCRLLREYLSACAAEMLPALQEFAHRRNLGTARRVQIEIVPDTPHKLVTVVFTPLERPRAKGGAL